MAASCADGANNIFDPKHNDLIDSALHLSRQDYRDLDDPNAYKKEGDNAKISANVMEPPIPDLAEILATPKPPEIGATQIVSIAVTDDVPLKDVLIELARLADVDIEVDSTISGGITFRAKDRPFNEVIERITDLAGLRYTMKNNVLRVERDTPYVQMYSLDFLNLDRTSDSTININTSVLSSGAGGGGGSSGLNSGSTASIDSKADNDFWKQFEASVRQILDYKPTKRMSTTDIADQPTPTLVPPPAGSAPTPAPATAPAAAGASGGTPVEGAAAVKPMAAAAAAKQSAAPKAPGAKADPEESFYILNKQAGTLTVSGTQKQHDLLKQFIAKIKANATSQVLIEAKIVEVTLKDQFQSGIDWSKLGSKHISMPISFKATDAQGAIQNGPFNSSNGATFNFSQENLTGAKIDLDLAVQLAELFGTTRTLSSPRLHAMNNQQAVLTFAVNQVYFTLQVTAPTSTTPPGGGPTTQSQPTINSTVHTVPIGIIMTLQPSIDLENNEVTLNIRPTLSKIVGQVNDPQVAITIAQLLGPTPTADQLAQFGGVTSQIPIVQVRELDSVLKLKSGQVMVIGGLMSNESENTDQGVPGVSSVPWVGNLFKSVNKNTNNQELVIFIRATIVDSAGNATGADKSIYEKFTKDPRPLDFNTNTLSQ